MFTGLLLLGVVIAFAGMVASATNRHQLARSLILTGVVLAGPLTVILDVVEAVERPPVVPVVLTVERAETEFSHGRITALVRFREVPGRVFPLELPDNEDAGAPDLKPGDHIKAVKRVEAGCTLQRFP
jgi:hypothetical protein